MQHAECALAYVCEQQCLQGVDLDSWIEKVRRCAYLQEDELKALCEYVSYPQYAFMRYQQHTC